MLVGVGFGFGARVVSGRACIGSDRVERGRGATNPPASVQVHEAPSFVRIMATPDPVDPSTLEIKIRSIEQTLLPLVKQVRLNNWRSYSSTSLVLITFTRLCAPFYLLLSLHPVVLFIMRQAPLHRFVFFFFWHFVHICCGSNRHRIIKRFYFRLTINNQYLR